MGRVALVWVSLVSSVLLVWGPSLVSRRVSPLAGGEAQRPAWRPVDALSDDAAALQTVSLQQLLQDAARKFEWRQLSDVLRWWKEAAQAGGGERALTLDRWPEPDIDMDECQAVYRDAKHNEVCVISR